ncbi:hypothetical protein MXH69_004897, partial [Salmonella enterica]|nr:hypothetical protein [Salmonella enterica]
DATNTTVSTDRSAANADNKETITVTLTPRDSHNNVVPLWTFRKDLTIVPSVNATVPGAVTVTTPAQDAAGAVAATLTYVDTSGKLLSKEARAGTTTITIGKAVKQAVDTRFYPQVHVCTSNLSASGFIVPGQTEVQICDGSGHAVPHGSGYTVTLPGMSSAGCTKSGGGVCPPDTAGVKADFTGLTGDDIAQLVFHPANYNITDNWSLASFKVSGPNGVLIYYGELRSHFPYAALGTTYNDDLFHTADAKAFCSRAVNTNEDYNLAMYTEGLEAGAVTGGTTNDSTVKTLFIGRIADAFKTGGATNPELFVSGGGHITDYVQGVDIEREHTHDFRYGTLIPRLIVMVNGSAGASKAWSSVDNVPLMLNDGSGHYDISIGWSVVKDTGWDLSDMYYVNNWPGKPLTQHKPAWNDTTNAYVTQVNYVSGYVCHASLR